MDPQISLFSNFFIKNGSHGTIHTFKNYFTTVFFNFQFSAVSKRTLSVFLHKNCYHIPPLYLSSCCCCEASLSEKELLVLDDESLVGKDKMVDANVNGAIDGDFFINCPPLSKTKAIQRKNK